MPKRLSAYAEKIIQRMERLGYHYDRIESGMYKRFIYDGMEFPLIFTYWCDVEDWMRGYCEGGRA